MPSNASSPHFALLLTCSERWCSHVCTRHGAFPCAMLCDQIGQGTGPLPRSELLEGPKKQNNGFYAMRPHCGLSVK